jgi:hypothetical protein
LLEVLSVSEQKPEQSSGEPGAIGSELPLSTPSDARSEPATASVQESEQDLKEGSTDTDPPKREPEPEQGAASKTPEVQALKADAQAPEAPKSDTSTLDSPKTEAPRPSGTVIAMSPGTGPRGSQGAGTKFDAAQMSGMFGKRRLSALAAVVALAVAAGAIGGALATAGLQHFVGDDAAISGHRGLEASVARIDADILALKASVEQTAKSSTSQFGKTSERLDKVEKAQAEPAVKFAKLSEAVDKLRNLPTASAAATVAAKEVTGSIAPPATAPATAPPKAEVARLPKVDGWVLRDVVNGGALIQNRQGLYEVYAGDSVPGLGRVDAVRRQDGRWVVVTSKGLIVAR